MFACSMAEEFPQLMPDISELEWATEAFGAPPEATNLWIGGDESVTSFHKACLGPFLIIIPVHDHEMGRVTMKYDGRQARTAAVP